MISEAKCVGLKVYKTKDGGYNSFVYLDVSHLQGEDNNIFGNIIGSSFQRRKISQDIVGKDILVSIDDFGNVKDIEV